MQRPPYRAAFFFALKFLETAMLGFAFGSTYDERLDRRSG